MLDPDAFHATPEAAAWRIARTGQPSDAGELVQRSVAASIGATLPSASPEVQTAAAAKALVALAVTEWDAAANGMAALVLAGQNRLVTMDALASGNVVNLRDRRP
ncbi:hypothetical protein [Falsiroseomonas sp. E2-1-a20]|uniref:hypothetical protein n=1 Tax=Falsiroseomonas sp. E2-1-a20 TaxID=3239300 RepID=UPI003F31035D